MLTLERRFNQVIRINDDISITVLQFRSGKVSIGVHHVASSIALRVNTRIVDRQRDVFFLTKREPGDFGIIPTGVFVRITQATSCLGLTEADYSRYDTALRAVSSPHGKHYLTLRTERKDRSAVCIPHFRARVPVCFCHSATEPSRLARPPPLAFLAAPGVCRLGSRWV